MKPLTKVKVATLARKYGLSEEDFWILLGDGRCPLCQRPYGPTRLPVVDHDHRLPMRVRGVVCSACNWLLGMRSDDAVYYARVAAYLTSPPAYDLPGPPRLHHDSPSASTLE